MKNNVSEWVVIGWCDAPLSNVMTSHSPRPVRHLVLVKWLYPCPLSIKFLCYQSMIVTINKFMYLKHWIVLNRMTHTIIYFDLIPFHPHPNSSIDSTWTLPPLPTPSPDMSWCKQTGSMTDSILSEDFFLIIYKEFNVLLYLYLSWLINKMT